MEDTIIRGIFNSTNKEQKNYLTSSLKYQEPPLFKKLIEDRKLSYKTVAKLVGVSELSIHRYANGERKPTWDIAKRILEVFGLTSNDFVKLFDPFSEKK